MDNGSNQGTIWRGVSFSDGLWKQGTAPLGYGDEEATLVQFGSDSQNKFVTTYFRRKFYLEDKSSILALSMGLRRDDGAVVYLNNAEIFRSNMPDGTILYNTLATRAVGGGDEDAFMETDVDPTLLRNGLNVVAVEVHQAARTSSDIVFDLRLSGISTGELPPPTLAFVVTSSGMLQVKWPDTVLQWSLWSTSSLTDSAAWQRVNTTIQLVNGQRIATVPINSERQFFRLSR